MLKKVRCILSKLTPEKFYTLLPQIHSLKINTPELLRGTVNIIFEKAVNEPDLPMLCARLCRQLSHVSIWGAMLV